MRKDNTAILIPARYESKRFPGKPLCDLGGTSMIQRVVDACKKTKLPVYVLTDDVRISNTVKGCDLTIVSDKNFANGTERCADGIDMISSEYKYFINVQGDMPDVTVEMIESCKELLDRYDVSTVFTDLKDNTDPNTVKLIKNDILPYQALWCGRGFTGYGDWHLGVYGYRQEALIDYPYLFEPVEEKIEGLEQLRWLKNGYEIGCTHVEFDGIEINTPNDVDEWHKDHFYNL